MNFIARGDVVNNYVYARRHIQHSVVTRKKICSFVYYSEDVNEQRI